MTITTGVVAGALAIGLIDGPGARAVSEPDQRALPLATSQPGKDRTVTLVTGDKVVLHGGDLKRVTVDPGPGRDKVVFKLQRSHGRLSVLPLDVSSAVTSGKLDRRLFDVSGLLELGYDDQRSATIPLIVSAKGRATTTPLPGATVRRQLPAIGATAVTVDKKAAGQFLRTSRDAAGIDQVWLDGKRKVLLDKSVPQIGAPKAWQAGFTGKGVKIAVLDTGIDPFHPDVKGRIGATKNFTTDPAGDQFGHGTHVASTVAGSGAASGGKYKGVAPDATLLDGKVCDRGGGCPDSAMLAGLQWAAVEQKAAVVNFSIGGPDTPEVDPIEAAINRLTAQTGTLFVVAAGNEGPGDGSISSPGSADAALTVGAVDKSDQLAEFSSRGPRVGDGAIKPDVTGPGVDIVAAKAKDAVIGDPVGPQYLTLSGTSMATPHVAGAAALLAQQHPGWKARELKPAVMASAKIVDGQTVQQQGAGRVDIAKGITQLLMATPGSVSFGTALWPHADDKPVTEQVTFRNLGKTAVTLQLRLTATGPDGKPAPATAMKLGAQSVTVPAGGTASVAVTSDTRHQGTDGQYAGRLVATGAGSSLSVPLAAEKEVESYDVTVKHLGPDGKGTGANYTTMVGLTGNRFVEVLTDAQGTARLRLPKGEYFVDGNLTAAGQRVYQLVWPKLVVDRATTVAVDARKAGPLRITVPRSDARLARVDVGYERPIGEYVHGNSTSADALDRIFVASMGPSVAKGEMASFVSSRWGVPGRNGDFHNTPYTYDLLQGRTGSYFTGYQRTVHDHELAKLTTQYVADHAGQKVFDERFGTFASMYASSSGRPISYDVPRRVTHFVDAKDVTWAAQVNTFVADGEYYLFPLSLSYTGKTFRPGLPYGERWGAAVATMDAGGGGVYRQGNSMDFFLFPNGDGDGHDGQSDEVGPGSGTKVFRDGKLLDQSTVPGQLWLENVPAAKAAYRLEIVQTRPMLQLANRMEGVWTFSSQDTGEDKELLPLKTVRFTPRVDEWNAVKRLPISVLDLTVTSAPGAKVTRVESVVVQVSGDGGKTWQRASVLPAGKNKYKVVFTTPAGAKLVSLKSRVVDQDGNTATQTVLNAYRLR
ncbi:S8 family serine peptidase [Kribbella sp. ALI-6-A]|uniref:S8 family serine peptidase n=1 Tax=Kribbella sp. ALI-6-A TaxID=1933817 RepID=UPI00143D785A|nr:S8 family serine peptidase [Kribbella sp. ALI-6-A]